MLSHLVMSDCFAALQTVAHQAPLSMEFSRQEYWSGLPFRSPRDLPHPGIKPTSLASPALAGRFVTISATWEAWRKCQDLWKSGGKTLGVCRRDMAANVGLQRSPVSCVSARPMHGLGFKGCVELLERGIWLEHLDVGSQGAMGLCGSGLVLQCLFLRFPGTQRLRLSCWFCFLTLRFSGMGFIGKAMIIPEEE